MAPNIQLDSDGVISMVFGSVDEARQTGIVLQRAGVDRRGRVRDSGFYHDGRRLQELADEAESRERGGRT